MSLELIHKQWAHIREGLLQTLDKFQDEELDLRAYPNGWTVRQIALHIAQEELGEFAYGISQELAHFPEEFAAADYPDRQSIKDLLDSVHNKTLGYLAQKTDDDLYARIQAGWGAEYPLIEMIIHMMEHEVHHRGELSLILGISGRAGYDA